MRITFNMQSDETLLNINNQENQINQISESLSSGVTMQTPADNPYSWAQSMNIQQGLREYNSVLNNINFASGWEESTDSALNSLSNLVSQAQQIAISASNPANAGQSAAFATQVGGILQQAVGLANSQYGDQYIFAGSATGSPPFSIDSSTGAVTDIGDQNPIEVRTDVSSDPNNNSTINLTGDDVFTYTSGGNSCNVLNQLWQLQQALSSGNSTAISNSITTLNDAFNSINSEITINGARLSALNTQKSAISVVQTNDQGQLSNLQDTNMATATTQLQQAQTAFEASLKVVSMLTGLNLASYLSSTTTA